MKAKLKYVFKQLWLYLVLFLVRITEAGEDLVNHSLFQLAGKDHSLSAAFAKESTILSPRNKGFVLTGTKAIRPEISKMGLLVTGGSGSGKSTIVGIPNCLTTENSKIVHDPSGELFEQSSGFLKSQGYTVIRIDWSDANHSHNFNSLERVNTLSEYSKLATQLVEASSNKKDKGNFWNSMAIQLLVTLIRIVKQLPEEYQTLSQVASFLDLLQSKSGQKEVDQLVASVSDNDNGLFEKYASLIGNSENTLSSSLASATTAVQMYALDENVISITSSDSLGDFKKWRKEKTVVYIHSSTVNMSYYAPLSSIFLQQYFESLFKSLPTEDELDIDFILDEAPILSIELDVLAANVRKYRGSLLIICQDHENQLTSTFGRERARSILSNLKTQLYLTTNLETAQRLSKELGTFEYTDRKTNQTRRRELMTPGEIMSLPAADKGLITIAGQGPVLARLTPHYLIPRLKRMSKMPPALDDDQITERKDNTPRLLNLTEYLESFPFLTPKTKTDAQN